MRERERGERYVCFYAIAYANSKLHGLCKKIGEIGGDTPCYLHMSTCGRQHPLARSSRRLAALHLQSIGYAAS